MRDYERYYEILLQILNESQIYVRNNLRENRHKILDVEFFITVYIVNGVKNLWMFKRFIKLPND